MLKAVKSWKCSPRPRNRQASYVVSYLRMRLLRTLHLTLSISRSLRSKVVALPVMRRNVKNLTRLVRKACVAAMITVG